MRSIDGHVSTEEAKQLISSRKNGTDQITRERSIDGIEFRLGLKIENQMTESLEFNLQRVTRNVVTMYENASVAFKEIAHFTRDYLFTIQLCLY